MKLKTFKSLVLYGIHLSFDSREVSNMCENLLSKFLLKCESMALHIPSMC